LCISEEIDKRKLERITVEGPVLRLLESEEERKKEIELTEDQAKEINGGELDLTEYSNLN
jgi:hypothetical protein